MSYHQPMPWTPRYENVPMLGDTPQLGTFTQIALVGGTLLFALFLVGATGKPRVRANARRRRRSSRRVSRNRTSRRRRSSRRTSRRRAQPNRITKAARSRIARRWFVFPDRRAPDGGMGTWPLDNARRARAAVDYLRMGRVASASDFAAIRAKLIKLWPGIWGMYGRGDVTWEKSKRARAKRLRSRRRSASRKAA